MRLYIVVVLILAGCSSQPQAQTPNIWWPSAQEWESVRKSGVPLTRSDKTRVFLRGEVIDLVLTVKHALEKSSAIKAELGVYDSSRPNAYSTIYEGKAYVFLSLSYLDLFGSDPDVLATTIGHEYAHIHLGHEAARNERASGGGFLTWFIGASAQSFTRDQEREADQQGIQWAMEAGFDVCGQARMARELSKLGLTITFLSTHPSYAERSEVASEYARMATGRGC